MDHGTIVRVDKIGHSSLACNLGRCTALPEWGSNILAQGRASRRNVVKRRPGYWNTPQRCLKGRTKMLEQSSLARWALSIQGNLRRLLGIPRASLRFALG